MRKMLVTLNAMLRTSTPWRHLAAALNKTGERRPLHDYVIPDQAGPGRTLHEPAARWTPNEPEPGRDRHEVAVASPTHPSCR